MADKTDWGPLDLKTALKFVRNGMVIPNDSIPEIVKAYDELGVKHDLLESKYTQLLEDFQRIDGKLDEARNGLDTVKESRDIANAARSRLAGERDAALADAAMKDEALRRFEGDCCGKNYEGRGHADDCEKGKALSSKLASEWLEKRIAKAVEKEKVKALEWGEHAKESQKIARSQAERIKVLESLEQAVIALKKKDYAARQMPDDSEFSITKEVYALFDLLVATEETKGKEG